MEKATSKSYFTIEKRTNDVLRSELFDRISDLSTIRNPKRNEFLKDLDKLVTKYQTVPSLSKKLANC